MLLPKGHDKQRQRVIELVAHAGVEAAHLAGLEMGGKEMRRKRAEDDCEQGEDRPKDEESSFHVFSF